eukprot:gene1012-9918_t
MLNEDKLNNFAPGEDEYQDFEDDYKPFQSNQVKSYINEPKTTTQKSSTNTRQSLTSEDALREKALELARREAALEQREQNIGISSDEVKPAELYVVDKTKPNWPICYPIVRHDIRGEIESGLGKIIASMAYMGWFAIIVVCVLNHLASYMTSFTPVNNPQYGVEPFTEKLKFMLVSFAYIPFVVPGHFILCYWPLYACLRSLHIFRFLLFFAGYSIAVIFCLFNVLGIASYGSSGLFLAFQFVPPQGSWFGFLIALFMTFLWAVMAIYYVVVYLLMVVMFRRKYASMKDAQDHAKEEAMRGVGETVKAGIQTGIQAGLQTSFSQNQQ